MGEEGARRETRAGPEGGHVVKRMTIEARASRVSEAVERKASGDATRARMSADSRDKKKGDAAREDANVADRLVALRGLIEAAILDAPQELLLWHKDATNGRVRLSRVFNCYRH